MKNYDLKSLNKLLAFGMLLMFAGILLLICFAGESETVLSSVFSLLISLIGLVFLYNYIGISKSPFKLFMGLSLTIIGLFCLAVFRNVFKPLSIVQLWPCILIIISISLFCSTFLRVNGLNLAYGFLSVGLFIFGVIFLLFSLDVIKQSFLKLMVYVIPVLIILSGVFLIALFFQRKALIDKIPEELSKKIKDSSMEYDGEDL